MIEICAEHLMKASPGTSPLTPIKDNDSLEISIISIISPHQICYRLFDGQDGQGGGMSHPGH